MKTQIIFSLFAVALAITSGIIVSERLDNVAYASESDETRDVVQTTYYSHRVVPGETLYGIAKTYFRDPDNWSLIAAANALSNPEELRAGMTLQIPRVEGFIEPPKFTPDRAASSFVADNSQIEPSNFNEEQDRYEWHAIQVDPAAGENGFFFARVAADQQFLEFKSSLNEDTVQRTAFDSNFGSFRYAYISDGDNDGREELNTVWKVGDDAYVRRVYAASMEGVSLSEIVENDPVSLAWEIENFPDQAFRG